MLDPDNGNGGPYPVLPGYESQLGDDAVGQSAQKLEESSKELEQFVGNHGSIIVSFPCKKEEDTLGYRCKCSFQVIFDGSRYHYAMRHKQEPVALESFSFPVANRRIQSAMRELWERVLNAGDEGCSRFPALVNTSLASITFAASWAPCNGVDKLSSDCIVTLNYDAALEKTEEWLKEAGRVCQQLKLTQLHGRSRKRLLSATPDKTACCLRDTIYLVRPTNEHSWRVALQKEDALQSSIVHYRKPEGAFYHPNARVMCQALQWMLDRIATIVKSSVSCRLLEMYCGCGAHTLALAKSGLLSAIQAVELDSRLVEACKVNIELNATDQSEGLEGGSMTPVQVVRGDAGQWARKHRASSSFTYDPFHVLLADPPRQGLDEEVIELAIQCESFQHVLIISCGHQALVRDLQLLCSHFDVTNCTQLDLFPRTDSVETLVHLRRRSG